MPNTIEDALRRACDGEAGTTRSDESLGLLWAQWQYDKRLLSSALQQVGQFFPHYSRHDASHSRAIVTQIGRLLGPARIASLSATDLWLLLEAAYTHDIAMVVTDSQARKWFDEPGFQQHLEDMANHEDGTLRSAAKLLLGTPPLDVGKRGWGLDVRRAVTLVVAEYARGLHADRAPMIASAPQSIGLQSPRNELIPARLFHVLGQICGHHGKSFKDTMTLPNGESGMGADDAHPRFVACMLRLGDLLDLDSNRFCPVLMRCFGSLPASSIAHVHKHAAVKHLNVTTSRVEVTAVCEDYESYEVTENWFGWLRTELQNQASRWADIVPKPEFGALASAGKISASVKGHIPLRAGQRPRFEVDRSALVTLVQGANLYTERFSCIRELLQNAVDATLLRAWMERHEHEHQPRLEESNPAMLQQWLKRWPINVSIKKDKPEHNASGTARRRWTVSIQDCGTGITLADVRNLQRVGGAKNARLQRAINQMPEWMRPSGAFGIGLHSVFLVATEVRMLTRDFATGAGLHIKLTKPSGHSGGGISVREPSAEELEQAPRGTLVEFDLEVDAIPSRVTMRRESPEEEELLRNYDPIVDTELPYEVARARGMVRRSSKQSICSIRLKNDQWNPAKSGAAQRLKAEFIPELLVTLELEAGSNHGRVELWYRGMPIETRMTTSLPMYAGCNLHFGDAKTLLTLNREKLSEHGSVVVQELLDKARRLHLPRYLKQLRSAADTKPEELQAASLCALFLLSTEHGKLDVGDEWQKLPMPHSHPSVTFGELADADEIVVREISTDPTSMTPGARPIAVKRVENTFEIEAESHQTDTWWFSFLQSRFAGITLSIPERTPVTSIYTFTKKIVTTAIDESALKQFLRRLGDRHGVGNRSSLPAPDGFGSLNVESLGGTWISSWQSWLRPRMVSPLVSRDKMISVPSLREYVAWVVQHGAKEVTEKEVAESVMKFIELADRLMEKDWAAMRDYSLDECRLQLATLLK